MIELQHDELIFSFPEVHPDAHCRIGFQRTLRIPDDNREYPLPAGLGRFPLLHVDDYAASLPADWPAHGGVFMPMYQAEAMWIHFRSDYPMAVKIAAGKINAVTGDPWGNSLSASKQDYVVLPSQPWLDGFCVQESMIRQFVAMPLGQGYTAEEQLTGAAEHGGLQILVHPMKRDTYERTKEHLRTYPLVEDLSPLGMKFHASRSMGLAPGGLMRQRIHEDTYGLSAWDTSARSRCFVHLINSTQFHSVTGYAPPHAPPAPRDYAEAGLPWFEYYDGDIAALNGAPALAGLDSVAARRVKIGAPPLSENDAVTPTNVRGIHPRQSRVREWRD